MDTTFTAGRAPLARQRTLRILAIVIAVVLVSVLHYATSLSRPGWHDIYQHLYYLPVVIAAYWFGVPGGVLTALGASLLYLPHVQATSRHDMGHAVSQYADIVMFHLVGLVVGLLASAERRVTMRYRETAQSLESTHRDLLASQDHLRQSERLSAMGEVAAGLAHEIRNPLAGMKGALDIIASRAESGTPEAEFAGVAGTELARLDRLITEFLSFARPRDPELREASIASIVAHVLALLGAEADRRHVAVEVEPIDADVSAFVDDEQISQVIFNVVLNAVQASSAGSMVRLRVAREPGWTVIDVRDEGPGIPADQLARIFDPFFTTRTRGTGLGLAISQRIVLAHHGTIEIVSSCPAAGTVLRIKLPRSGEASAAAPDR